VDEVVLSQQYSPDYLKVLEMYDCDFCVHGSDVNLNSDGKDPFEDVKKAGKFRSLERVDFISSTDVINRLLKATHKDLRVQRYTEAEMDADSFLLTTDRLCQFMNTTRHQPHKPREGQRVVYVGGSWDLFHSGHVRLLQEAKKQGDFLLVGIHEDTSVQTHCSCNKTEECCDSGIRKADHCRTALFCIALILSV
jgi:ethanolamine-phosphate cytidylyltransferase